MLGRQAAIVASLAYDGAVGTLIYQPSSTHPHPPPPPYQPFAKDGSA